MALEKKIEIKGTGVHVSGNDIDTDRIIPARYMKCVTFEGLGEYAFYDVRIDEDGNKRDHPLNVEPFNKGSILLSGSNFGCGSSREHAPQALYYWGIRAIVAESFADIFFGNSTTLGIPCVCATKEIISEIASLVSKEPTAEINVNVESLKLSVSGKEFDVAIPKSAQYALINGSWDLISELIDNEDEVAKISESLSCT